MRSSRRCAAASPTWPSTSTRWCSRPTRRRPRRPVKAIRRTGWCGRSIPPRRGDSGHEPGPLGADPSDRPGGLGGARRSEKPGRDGPAAVTVSGMHERGGHARGNHAHRTSDAPGPGPRSEPSRARRSLGVLAVTLAVGCFEDSGPSATSNDGTAIDTGTTQAPSSATDTGPDADTEPAATTGSSTDDTVDDTGTESSSTGEPLPIQCEDGVVAPGELCFGDTTVETANDATFAARI